MANNPFITQASPMMGQTLIDPESLALQRQKQYAAALLQQSQQPQGQMVSGRYVAPSFTQQLNATLNPLLGAYMMNKADTKQTQLAEALRQEGVRDIGQYMSALQGKPESVTYSAEDVGPSMNVTPATGPDYNKALGIALGSRSPMVQALGSQTIGEMTKPQKLGEGEQFVRFNPNTNKYETIASGAEKFRAPLQVDTGNAIEFRDPRDPTKVLQVVPKSLSLKDRAELADKGIILGGSATPSSGMPMGGQGGGTQTVNMGAQAMGYTPNLAPVDSRALALDKAKRQQDFAEKAPAALEMMNQTLTNIDDLIGDTKVVNGKIVYGTKKPHEGFESSVGFSGAPLAKYISGSPVSDFRSRFDQIKDKTFLQAFENLKGAGQITEVEGAKATSALNRMSLAQSEKEFITAAREFEQNIKSGMELARKRAGMANSNSGWRVKP
jgi:hypothetical protein